MGGMRNPAVEPPARTRRKSRRTSKPGREAAAFEILQSKLEVPKLREGLVNRSALVSHLRAPTSARVISVTAPAGYGKTTLLAQWAADDPRPFAWVSLDDRDNDPAAFLTYLSAAADGIRPVEPSVFRGAASGADSLWTVGLPRLGAALAAIGKPMVLVLDDVHELRDRDCIDALEPIAKHLPDGAQLVLSGRAEERIPLARLRAAGRLLALGPAELALSDSEAKGVLTEAGVKVSAAEASSLNERTEGWVAGLYLAALFSQEAGSDELTRFSGDDRFVADYLRSEHLSRLKPSVLEFLTRTSILDRMCASLCDAVLDRSDSARRLKALEQANLFLVPLDHRREWYRYRHLFRDTLRGELDRLEPEAGEGLRRRAAAWYEGNGQPDAAIAHMAAAGDMDEVARLVGMFALPYYRSGRVVTVERWLKQLDDPKLLRRYPEVAAFGAFLNGLRGRPDDAERYWFALVRATLCRHGTAEMEADARVALRDLPAASIWHPTALALLGVSLLFEGEPERAEHVLEQTAEEAAGSGAIYPGLLAHSELALLALERGDGEKAEADLAVARALLENQPLEEYVLAAIYLAASAQAAFARGQAATARELLVRAMRLRPQLTHAVPWFGVHTRLELARTHFALGDIEGARTLCREAFDVISQRPELGTLRAQADELRDRLVGVASLDDGWASSLTAAELRLLPLLTTHLTFREIAERLYVS